MISYNFCHPSSLWGVSTSTAVFLLARSPIAPAFSWCGFLPFGQGPSGNDCCVEAVLKIAPAEVPSLRIVDFVGGLRMVDASGTLDALSSGMPKF